MMMRLFRSKQPVDSGGRERACPYTTSGKTSGKHMCKSKGIHMDRDYGIGLRLVVHHAEGIDNPSTHPSVRRRLYRVVFWVHSGAQHKTTDVWGEPNPRWDEKYKIELDRSKDCRFLYVEVIRCGYPQDDNPGTSYGAKLVGRAQIPLPKLSCKSGGRYGLVRLEGDGYKAEGHIALSMELVKLRYIN